MPTKSVVDLTGMSICLITKWMWKFENEVVFQNLVRKKYLANCTLVQRMTV